MSPFFKGVLGFFGCAVVTAVVYNIGKSVGREETLREIEAEERLAAAQVPLQQAIIVSEQTENQQENAEMGIAAPVTVQPIAQPAIQQPTPAEKVRKMHGLKNKIFGGGSIIKDLLVNPDNKKVIITVEDGDIVARVSPR